MKRAERLFIEAQSYFKAEAYEKAFELHLRSADLGYDAAQTNVGYAYLHGKGVVQDHEKAVEWFEKAAAQDNAPALINLGYCYLKGFGVAQDKQEALNCFARAAMLGSEPAQKHYDRLLAELGQDSVSLPQVLAKKPEETPAEPETPEEETEEEESVSFKSASTHYPDARQQVRKLIGADFRWLLIAAVSMLLAVLIHQLFGEQLPELLQILLWVVILGSFLVVAAGLSALSGYRNAKLCLDRLEELGLLDLAVEEITFGDPQPFGYTGCITDTFIYGNGAILAISDVIWVYPKTDNKFKALKVASKAHPPMTLSGAPKRDRAGLMDKTIALLLERKPGILVGNTAANKAAWKKARIRK